MPVENLAEDDEDAESESMEDEDQERVHAEWYRVHRLMFPKEAQGTKVVRIPQLLSSSEIVALMSEVRTLQEQRLVWQTQQCSKGPRKGWRTSYLHTNGVFGTRPCLLSEKLRRTIFEVDAANWNLLKGRELSGLTFRTVEYHEYTPGGQLSSPGHYDSGSLLTLDVMLSDSGQDFEGGQLSLPEADGSITTPLMKKGDAAMFVAHKYL